MKKKWILLLITSAVLLGVLLFYLGLQVFEATPEELEQQRISRLNYFRELIQNELKAEFTLNNYPSIVHLPANFADQDTLSLHSQSKIPFSVSYTIDEELQTNAEKLLNSYKPDYGAVVAMDALTGKILAMASYQKNKKIHDNLTLKGSFPAASIFKIITASAAVDKYQLSPNTLVFFNGANYTLYKKNVMSTKHNRWTRGISIKDAFARSINTVFGRLTFEHLQPKDLEDYAIRFGFNQKIASDLPFESGFADIPNEKNFHLAEIASGYNKVTRMSPIQGAMIGASIAADGNMKIPYVVDEIRDSAGKVVFKGDSVNIAQTVSADGAERLRTMMEATIKQGTSRKSFRSLVKNKKFKELIMGGKTGSLTGDNPKGKVDWFVGYAIGENERIAIAALTVNVDYWTVKSSYLAQSLFKVHFKDQMEELNDRYYRASNE
jgi:peptidoglycan glycosyltransferase